MAIVLLTNLQVVTLMPGMSTDEAGFTAEDREVGTHGMGDQTCTTIWSRHSQWTPQKRTGIQAHPGDN